jgi:hypothetical protein
LESDLGMATRSDFARRRVISLLAIMCVLVIAACGSSNKSSSAASGSYSQGVKYSDCMRSHGISNFPDPSPGGGFNIRWIGADETPSPAFVSAQTACAKLQPGGSAPPQITGEQVHEMFVKARCIRQHGFPNFPDPSLSGTGLTPPADWNPEAPMSITARKACAHVGIAIPGWGAAWFGPT